MWLVPMPFHINPDEAVACVQEDEEEGVYEASDDEASDDEASDDEASDVEMS